MKAEEFREMVARLRRQNRDDSICEAKSCAHNLSKDVWETVSAFANTEGGSLVLGLSEEKGFLPIPDFEIDKVRDQFVAGMGDGGSKGRLANPPHYSIEKVEFEGVLLLHIEISELGLSHKPCYIVDRGVQGGSYKRVDDADLPLSANEVYLLNTAAVVTDSDRRVVPGALLSDLDEELLTETFSKAQRITPRALKGAGSFEVKARRLNFIEGDGVSKAGLLVAGVYPQQFFPKLCVDVAVHSGTQKGGLGGRRFVDRTLCEGTLGEMIQEAVAAVSKNIRRSAVVRGVARSDELEIPEEVLREAIANALIHRAYDERFDGQSVAVDVFDDRIEVSNPGGLWGKTRDNLADGRSCCRNATLMRMMSLVPLPEDVGSPAEGNGSGIPFMVNESLLRGLEPPTFCPAIDHFKVILHRPSERRNAPTAVANGEAVILALLKEHGELSARELEEKSGLSISQVRSRMRKLLVAELVEATASETSRLRKYRVKGR